MVTELAELFGTTEVTIRSDLTYLEKEGRIVRMAGGAVLPKEETEAASSVLRAFINAPEKVAIARRMAEEVQDGDILFINAGSTTCYFAEALTAKKGLTVVTNSVKVAEVLGTVTGFRVLLLGGEFNAFDGFTYGNNVIEMINAVRAKFAVLSVDGMSPEEGVSTLHPEEVAVNRAMIGRAEKTVFLADYSKLGKTGFLWFADLGNGKLLVTDDKTDREVLRGLEEKGMDVIGASL